MNVMEESLQKHREWKADPRCNRMPERNRTYLYGGRKY